MSPLRRQNPREEPGALAAHAGICAGGGWQQSLLPRPTNDKARIEERGNVRDERRETTGQGVGASRGSSVNITPEHRTQIHDFIIKERSAPRVDHVEFNVSVGTVVPRSVRLVTVPRQIIEIEPEWRGYEYFMVGDQIVIVNPRSMEIVAVLDV